MRAGHSNKDNLIIFPFGVGMHFFGRMLAQRKQVTVGKNCPFGMARRARCVKLQGSVIGVCGLKGIAGRCVDHRPRFTLPNYPVHCIGLISQRQNRYLEPMSCK